MDRWKKHGSTSSLTQNLIYLCQLIFQFIPKFVYKILSLIEALEFKIWQKKFNRIKSYSNRKKMFLAIINDLNNPKSNSSKVNIYEFGVAFGELTQFIIKNIKVEYNYHGFDTFSGLPHSWRGLPKGAISPKNKTPKFSGGEGVKFHTGLIKDTISNVDFRSDGVNLFIFDFDLYEPTLFAYKYVRENIKKGDILVFDEAFAQDERIIIENYVFLDFKYKLIRSSPFAIAFEIV
jgi:hypothetical protein